MTKKSLKIGVQHDCAACKAQKKKMRSLLKYQLEITNTVKAFLAHMDLQMKKPSTEQRGKDIASLMNKLQLNNDVVRHFSLDLPLGE